MALVERLMHDPSEPDSRWIPVHQFYAGCVELVNGKLLSSDITNYYAMTAADLVDWNKIVALAPTTNVGDQVNYVNRIHAVLMLAEIRTPLYDTPTAVRAKLGI